MKFRKSLKKIKSVLFNKWVLFTGGFLLATLIASNIWVRSSTSSHIYDNIENLPAKKIGLVLGTSKRTSWGGTNLYFKYRMEAAAELYKKGKIKHIIVSGDNSLKSYNEPRDMKNALVEKGVPASKITLDFAGFRTLDSVVRCKEVFSQDEIIIITQRFHNERAIFIARSFNIDALGYAAKDVTGSYSLKTRLREYLAKYKAVIDLYVINKKPKFLGEKVDIEITE